MHRRRSRGPAAISAANSGPLPPNATIANSRGSRPRSIVTARTARAIRAQPSRNTPCARVVQRRGRAGPRPGPRPPAGPARRRGAARSAGARRRGSRGTTLASVSVASVPPLRVARRDPGSRPRCAARRGAGPRRRPGRCCRRRRRSRRCRSPGTRSRKPEPLLSRLPCESWPPISNSPATLDPAALDHRCLGRRAAHVEADRVGRPIRRASAAVGDDARRRPRLDDVDGPLAALGRRSSRRRSTA